MALIFWFSSSSGLVLLPEPTADLVLKKLAHFGAYLTLALLVGPAARPTVVSMAPAVAVLVAAVYAVTDELHQAFVATRIPSPVDLAIDWAGAASGGAILRLLYASRGK